MDAKQRYLNIMFEQFEGVIALTDKNNRCVYANDYTAKLFGYKNSQDIIGVDPYDMPCPAVESAEQFIDQYNYVFQTQKPLLVFDVHQYADQKHHFFITKKTPILDPLNNQFTQIMTTCNEINSQILYQMFAQLKNQRQYFEETVSKNISFYIGQLPSNSHLSHRELECLYHLVHGKSQKEIAYVMKLSPRTVESYFENIKNKLDIYNRSQLIEYAINLGLLQFIPEDVFKQELSLMLVQK